MPGGNGSDKVLKLAIDQYEQIVKLEPENVDDHLLLGRLYRLNNDLQKAEAELKTAIKIDPGSEEAVTTLAMLYTDEGDTAHALQVLSSVPDAARSAKLYSALGEAYEQRKDYKSAIDAFRHAIVLDRDNLDAIRGLAENLLNDGQPTPLWNSTRSSWTRIRKTRRATCASPRFIAGRPSTISRSKV